MELPKGATERPPFPKDADPLTSWGELGFPVAEHERERVFLICSGPEKGLVVVRRGLGFHASFPAWPVFSEAERERMAKSAALVNSREFDGS